MGVRYNPGIVTEGLILNLDAGDQISYPRTGTTWTDLSGNGHVGTLTNGPTFNTGSAGSGGSIDFDGSDDYVTIPDNSSLDVLDLDFTIELVLKSQGAVSSHESPFSRYIVSGEPGLYLYVNQTSGYASLRFNDSVNGEVNLHTGALDIRNDDTWHHLVWSMDRSGNGLVYGDAVLLNTVDISAKNAVCNITQTLSIGQNSGSGQRFDGQISIVRHYIGLALSPSQVLQNYNAIRSRFGI